MTLRNHPHLKRVSRFYTLSNALLSACVAVLFFSDFSFAAEPDDFFSLPKHDHPGILAVHDTLAVYKGTETMPEEIWPRVSVPFAVFTITDYLNYEIRGKYGREKQKSLNKFLPAKHQKPTPLQEKLLALKKGQTVLLCWEHRAGGPQGQVVNRLEVLTPKQAKQFRAEAVVAKSAREDRRKQGLHLTREAFLQRLRTLDPKQFSGVKPEELAVRTELYLRRPHLTDDDFLQIVKWMPALDNLHLRSAVFPKASLQRLTGLKNLTSLSLPFTGYQDEGLKNADMPLLSKLKSLKSLNLMGTEIRDEGLKAIGELKKLEHLNLKSCWIEGYGLQHLVQLKNLKELDLGRITRGRGIENEGFEHLGEMAELEKLSLRHCEKFSPESLDRLKGLKNLKTIDLYYAFGYRDDTSGALPALARLQKALPSCKVTGVQWKRLKENQEREELRD